jgi:hypothetical protein
MENQGRFNFHLLVFSRKTNDYTLSLERLSKKVAINANPKCFITNSEISISLNY